jgi:hypothetical protein
MFTNNGGKPAASPVVSHGADVLRFPVAGNWQRHNYAGQYCRTIMFRRVIDYKGIYAEIHNPKEAPETLYEFRLFESDPWKSKQLNLIIFREPKSKIIGGFDVFRLASNKYLDACAAWGIVP